jgi:hypothetical protein
MSAVWAVPGSTVNRHQILNFLEDARCSTRPVEVRLFKNDSLCKRIPLDSRRWGTQRRSEQNRARNRELHRRQRPC